MSPCELNKCCSWKSRRKVVPKNPRYPPRYPTNTPCFARVCKGNSVNCNFSKTKKQPKCPEGLRGTNSVEIPTVEAEFQQLNHLLMVEKSHQLNYIVQNATRISKAYRILVHSSFNFCFFSMRATRLPLKCRLFVGVESSTPASHYGLERLLNMICTFNERCVSFVHFCSHLCSTLQLLLCTSTG